MPLGLLEKKQRKTAAGYCITAQQSCRQAGRPRGAVTELTPTDNGAKKRKAKQAIPRNRKLPGERVEVNKALKAGRAAAADLLLPAPLNKAPVTAEL